MPKKNPKTKYLYLDNPDEVVPENTEITIKEDGTRYANNRPIESYSRRFKASYVYVEETTDKVPPNPIITHLNGKMFVGDREVMTRQMMYTKKRKYNPSKQFFDAETMEPCNANLAVPYQKASNVYYVHQTTGRQLITLEALFKRSFYYLDQNNNKVFLNQTEKEHMQFNSATNKLITDDGREVKWHNGYKNRKRTIETVSKEVDNHDTEKTNDFYSPILLDEPEQPLKSIQDGSLWIEPGVVLSLDLPESAIPETLLRKIKDDLNEIQRVRSEYFANQQPYSPFLFSQPSPSSKNIQDIESNQSFEAETPNTDDPVKLYLNLFK